MSRSAQGYDGRTEGTVAERSTGRSRVSTSRRVKAEKVRVTEPNMSEDNVQQWSIPEGSRLVSVKQRKQD